MPHPATPLFPHHGEAEEWRPVPGWEDLYAVSDWGRVRSFHAGAGSGKRGGLLKPWLTHGYKVVGLCRGGHSERWPVHQLVALAFLGPCPPGEQVRHGPNGKLDNRASELCYGTSAENNGPDKVRDGTINQGERHGIAKLTDAIVAECRVRHGAGETQLSLAREFGVDRAAMNHAIRGLTWTHVAEPPPVKRVRPVKAPGPGKGWRSGKTHCDNGHEFTPENTYIRPPTKAKPNPRRDCKICRRDRNNKSARKMRAQKLAA